MPPVRHAGAVDDDVQATELLDEFTHGAVHGVRIGDVRNCDERAIAELTREPSERTGPAGQQSDARALAHERSRRGLPDAWTMLL